MSAPFEHPMNIPPLDQFDPNLFMYDMHYGGFQRPAQPTTPQEGFAFWYRRDAQENIYQDATMYNQGVSMQPVTMAAMGEPASIKHRRTRSGCFTCRSRRVKCDETRPICDRCRKGNRECEFPQSSSSSKRMKGEPRSAASETANDTLDTIKDESEDDDFEEEEDLAAPALPVKHSSRRPSLARKRTQSTLDNQRSARQMQQSTISETCVDQPPVPSPQASILEPTISPTGLPPSPTMRQRWRQIRPDLKPEMEKYLHFQHDHMTYYHYLFKIDPKDFVHSELIELALRFEPLLYAVVAFAAYHHTVRLPDSEADFNSFWKYYSKSIVKLRHFLEHNNERDDLVLLTVLQLATFEEYMGDWTSLATHHRAAHGILTSKYTPESIMKTDRGRKILDWFVRLDVISGLMAIRNATLDRAWLAYAHKWYAERRDLDEERNIDHVLECFSKEIQLTGRDMAKIFAEANITFEQPDFSFDNVLEKVQELHVRLDNLRQQIQELNDPTLAVVDNHTPQSEDEAFNAKIPLFRDKLWALNFVWIDWYGLYLILKNQTLVAMAKAQRLLQETKGSFETNQEDGKRSDTPQIPPELAQYAQIQCEIYNAIIMSPSAPSGASLICYANLGISTVFLPRAPPAANSKYTMWSRRQLANIERQGYVWPPRFRKEMAILWDDPSIEVWWLPNGEGKKKILSDIRLVVQDRIAAAAEGPDDGRGDLREIKGLFENMEIGRRRSSTSFDPSYINSSVGMAHAASLVSTPEEASSTGSVAGFSPHASTSEAEDGKSAGRVKKASRDSQGQSPLQHSRNAPGNRMSGIWE